MRLATRSTPAKRRVQGHAMKGDSIARFRGGFSRTLGIDPLMGEAAAVHMDARITRQGCSHNPVEVILKRCRAGSIRHHSQ